MYRSFVLLLGVALCIALGSSTPTCQQLCKVEGSEPAEYYCCSIIEDPTPAVAGGGARRKRSATSLLLGAKLNRKRLVRTGVIRWKQGSFLGFGGSRAETYSLYEYEIPSRPGSVIPVFIQNGFNAPRVLTVTRALQFGMNNGIFFFVYHDKENKPYQHRFIRNDFQMAGYKTNDLLKAYTKGLVDLSWVVGDYLRDF